MLPPFGLSAVLTQWQFAPVVTVVAVLLAGLYGWGALRVSRRHPARPRARRAPRPACSWPASR